MTQAGAGWRGAVVAPHAGAAEIGRDVLRDGGNAYEAMVAAAAAIAVLYPHMNGLGGDGFWLVQEPGQASWGIDAAGPAAAAATPAWYRQRGCEAIPRRGSAAANTVAGTVAGWMRALAHSTRACGGRLPLSRLLGPAVELAREGVGVTRTQALALAGHGEALSGQAGFAALFLPDGRVPEVGERFRQPELAAVLQQLIEQGLSDFYRGDVAATLASGLERVGSPLGADDLADYQAIDVTPLRLGTAYGWIENLPPPTQGLASLLILGLEERFRGRNPCTVESADHVHALVEATKRAFAVRDRVVTDPGRVPGDVAGWLSGSALDELGGDYDPLRATGWGARSGPGDTVWMGAIDREGRRVSFIQSLFHEFGSGVVVPDTGILWQNRGSAFDLKPGSVHELAPGRQPFHTLNPPMANLADGRTVVYGTMGGHGQPQTQAAILTRLVQGGVTPETAVARPRWLLGKAWGEDSDSLKIEADMAPEVVAELERRGHDVEQVPAVNSLMGHAGMLVQDANGRITGASDPRCDGAVAGVD